MREWQAGRAGQLAAQRVVLRLRRMGSDTLITLKGTTKMAVDSAAVGDRRAVVAGRVR